MAKFIVIAEFFDKVAKKRRQAGDVVEVSAGRAKRLKDAGVLGREVKDKKTSSEDGKKVR